MTDYFALFDEPRRPWLDSERLKAKFLTQSSQAHPDRIHAATAAERESANRRFSELNAAFNCLREPKERLRHLLQLELGETRAQVVEIPAELTELFTEIARLRRGVSTFLVEAARAQSPLLRVRVFEQAQEWMDQLRRVQNRLGDRQAALLREVQTMDAEWSRVQANPAQRTVLLQRVERLHQQLSFYTRWTGQLQEAMVQLSF